jgi:hypothetical protein
MLMPVMTTLEDFAALHPPDTAYVPCSSLKEAGLVVEDEWRMESITGTTMTCLGRMPALVHRNVATDSALDFFRLAGIEPPSKLQTYASDDEATRLAHGLAARGIRLATIYPQIESIRALGACLVTPELYGWLNDKTNLEFLCPAPYLPKREIHSRTAAARLTASGVDFPLYVKGAVAGANGSGNDVRYCTGEEEFRAALEWFRDATGYQALIIEQAIPFTATWCLNFAILDRNVRWIGGAEQVFDSPGNQSGNCIDPRNPPPARAIEVGLEICEAAQAKGYRGIVGFDMCVDAEGGIYFFDLNFRLAACTCLILLERALEDPSRVSLTCNFPVPGRLADALNRVEDLVRAKSFIPLRLYDGSACTLGDVPSVVTGFVRGNDRDAAQSLIKEMECRLKG